MGSASPCPGTALLDASKSSRALNKLYWAIGLCSFFMVAEIVGGLMAKSLAIITDAVHLLSDVAGFFTSIAAILIARRRASSTYSFGFQRAQTLGALLSIGMVWVLTGYLVLEAIDRLKHPEEINGKLMFFISILGLAVNIMYGWSICGKPSSFVLRMILALGHDHHHEHGHEIGDESAHTTSAFSLAVEDLNLRAALIHVFGDLLQSIGVVIASALIWYNPEWRVADPICTLLFSVIVFVTTMFISRDIVRILMEGTPREIDPRIVSRDMKNEMGVEQVHDLHIWSLAPGNIALTAHVKLTPDTDVDSDAVLARLQSLICSKYRIHHSTIQLERSEGHHCNQPHCAK